MIGQTIGSYQIIEQIGMGGMATVYKAFEPGVERYVALKVLPERYAQEHDFVERFKREAKTIARLEHKHILPIYAFGEDGGITYLAMRYLPGGTLKELGASGRLDLLEIARLIEQICSALDYAHRQGVIHRDVKPSNILISEEGDAYLMDFGIAKVLEGVSELTATGATIGTPAYMAPEQAMAQEIDHRADIYAVGVILYELAVGKPPYEADTPMAVLLQHIQNPLPLPRHINPDIPEPVQEVIIKALAKNPKDRYATANDLATALNTTLQGFETMVRRGTTLQMLVSDVGVTRQAISSPPSPPPAPLYYGADADTVLDKPPPSRRRLPWFWMGSAALLMVIVVVGILLVVLGVIGTRTVATSSQPIPVISSTAEEVTEPISSREESEPPTATPIPVPTETPIPYPAVAPYDTFDDPAFDGSFNPGLWTHSPSSCTLMQTDGVLSFAFNQESPGQTDLGCEVVANPGSLPPLSSDLESIWLRMQIPGDRDPNFIGITAAYLTQFDGGGYYNVSCGIHGWQPTEMGIALEATDGRLEDSQAQVYWQSYTVIQHDRWYTVHLTVDPTTLTFSCDLDGETVGTFTPDNAEELASQRWDYVILSWRDRGSATNIGVLVDDVYFIPSE